MQTGCTPPTQSDTSLNTIIENRERTNKQERQPKLPWAQQWPLTAEGLEMTCRSSPPSGIFCHSSSQASLPKDQAASLRGSALRPVAQPGCLSPAPSVHVGSHRGLWGASLWGAGTRISQCCVLALRDKPGLMSAIRHHGFLAARTSAWSLLSRPLGCRSKPPSRTVNHIYQCSVQGQ